MKTKLILVIGLLVLLLMPAGLALADNGPHGSYTATTAACAGCHRAHTAGGARLLLYDMPDLCLSCHGISGNGANTNVIDGQYLDRTGDAEGDYDRGLKGGGFVNTVMATTWPTSNTSPISATSTHDMDGATLGTVWGYGSDAIPAYQGLANYRLSCVSCHDPHGGASSTGGATYRLLRSSPLITVAGAVDVSDSDEDGNWWYTVQDNCMKSGNQYFAESYDYPASCPSGYPNAFVDDMDTEEKEMSAFCGQCHSRYVHDPNNGALTAGSVENTLDSLYVYRHLSTDRPTACFGPCHDFSGNRAMNRAGPRWGGNYMNHNVECMTCHVAHGSSAQMTGFATGTFDPSGALGPVMAGDSSLLRVDNRGVCELCHGKGGTH